MAETYWERFEEEEYSKELLELSRKTAASFHEKEEEIRMLFSEGIHSILKKAVLLQEKGEIPPLAELTVSFLFSSFYFGQPEFRLDCYGKGGYLMTESLLTETVPADWLTRYVEEMGQTLFMRAKQEGLARYIRPAGIYVLCLRAVRSLLLHYSGWMKYRMPELLDFKKYSRLILEESFRLSFGEYLDWQRVLYAKLPEVDLFNCSKETSFLHRTFHSIYYEKKTLENLDLTGAVFHGCTFCNTAINNCCMNDCLFETCIFEAAVIRDTLMAGCTFVDCTIEGVMLESVLFSSEKMEESPEVYKCTEWMESKLSSVQFAACDLNGCQLYLCQLREVLIQGGTLEDSDFSKEEGCTILPELEVFQGEAVEETAEGELTKSEETEDAAHGVF